MSQKPFRLSVKAVIHDEEDRILLLKRSMSSKGNPGKWDLPGGKIDVGEDFAEALMREVLEETGLTISIQRVAGTAESESNAFKVVYLIMEGRLEIGQLLLSDEHDEYLWVGRGELVKIDLCEQFRGFAREYSRMKD